MKFKLLSLWGAALVCVALMLSSCGSGVVGWGGKPKSGPPPHAPAHGYRHKYQDLDLVYDSGRGVYVVVGLASHYYCGGYFYRFQSEAWQVSANVGGPWKPARQESLPPGLRAKEKAKGKSKEPPGRGAGTQKKRKDSNPQA
jgi:hypothetical protein